MGLSPTLWRTCRVLAGPTRLALLRRILKTPGQSVSQLADAEAISWPRASQELRRLQSRGLVTVERVGRWVRYYPETDPLVSSAKPILRAMRETFARVSPAQSERVAAVAQGLGHPRRLDILRALRGAPVNLAELESTLAIPAASLWHHLEFMRAGEWVRLQDEEWRLKEPSLPLAQCLLRLL